MTPYKVQLDIYNGPLDLLLYLIRREEVDIFDIPIARVTKQYVQYVELLKAMDPEAAAEFLVMAASLMEIKSRMLLPRPPADEDEEDFEDPRLELVRQLLEYKKFKDAAFGLGACLEEQSKRFKRHPVSLPKEEDDFELQDVQIWDLFSAFNTLLSQTASMPTTHEVIYDDTPISLHAADIQDRLAREGKSLGFEALFEGRSKSEMVGLFLALLELVRQKRIRIEQAETFGPIYLYLIDETPITEDSILAVGEGEADEFEEAGEEEEAFPMGPRDGLDEDPEEEPYGVVDEELIELDASLDRISTGLEGDQKRRIDEIDRDMDVVAFRSAGEEIKSETFGDEKEDSGEADAEGETNELRVDEGPGETS